MSALPPYERWLPCVKCGRTFGMAEKPLVAYCSGTLTGTGPQGQPRESVCELGGPEEHLHRKCSDCNYQWAEACPAGEPPLTGDEIAIFRALVAHQEPKA